MEVNPHTAVRRYQHIFVDALYKSTFYLLTYLLYLLASISTIKSEPRLVFEARLVFKDLRYFVQMSRKHDDGILFTLHMGRFNQ